MCGRRATGYQMMQHQRQQQLYDYSINNIKKLSFAEQEELSGYPRATHGGCADFARRKLIGVVKEASSHYSGDILGGGTTQPFLACGCTSHVSCAIPPDSGR